ncbi:hypothetical protein ElyMa_005893100 [Elysia marginata]|uniref:Uncharacterized protein n=1 Tax=Elysia marginata TaxID=1093978 RepID=A0AAV4G6B0_9GAST|nr:hypothetical protein ElyMa_005893100 [Elysia marginata]
MDVARFRQKLREVMRAGSHFPGSFITLLNDPGGIRAWRLFRHIFRRDPRIPANEAMQFYFEENNKRPSGRPITTLPVTINNDLKHVPGEKMTLTSQKDLDLIRDIAENRDEWMTFIAEKSLEEEQPKLHSQTTLQASGYVFQSVRDEPNCCPLHCGYGSKIYGTLR